MDPLLSTIILAIIALGQTYMAFRLKVLGMKADAAKLVADQTHKLAEATEINTNSRYSEQLARIERQDAKILVLENKLESANKENLTELESLRKQLIEARKPPPPDASAPHQQP